ncbi:MAG: hypothetical protein C4318_06225 [Acidimicrobiia bacterium]
MADSFAYPDFEEKAPGAGIPFPRSAQYSHWDGSQEPFPLSPDEVFDRVSDEILEHGDVAGVLRRLLYRGIQVEGRNLVGLHEIISRLAQRRRELLRRYDPSGVLEKIQRALSDIESLERAGINRRIAEATRFEQEADGEDKSAAERFKERAQKALTDLDLLPPEVTKRLRALQQHDFIEPAAKRRLDELLEELRREAAQLYFRQASDALRSMDSAQLQRMKNMFAELNKMLEQRAAGEDPDFDQFMHKYGDFFPENPRDLDELLAALARRMAITHALIEGLPLQMREELQELIDGLLSDLDLRFEMERLSQNLAAAFPHLPWDSEIRMLGDEALSMSDLGELAEELADLDALEEVLEAAEEGTLGTQLHEVDFERVRQLLGEEEAASLRRLAELVESLRDAGLIDRKGSKVELTPKALRRIGGSAIEEIFKRLRRSALASNRSLEEGVGIDKTFQTRPWEWGDGFSVDIFESAKNAIRRGGPGVPIQFSVEDFEIEDTESLTRSATVLLLDLSLSMMMRDSFVAAKRLAFALQSLIASKFPHDYFSIVGFSELAREIPPRDLPEATWDGVYGTNMQHALMLARSILKNRPARTRQVIMVTDGEPTAHLEEGVPFFSYPPVIKTIEETLKEVLRCTREGITINVFMLDRSPHLVRFVQQMTKMNRGRAFFTTPERLGEFVLYDFLESKTRRSSPYT